MPMPYPGPFIPRDELFAFCKRVLAAWPGTVITVSEGGGAAEKAAPGFR